MTSRRRFIFLSSTALLSGGFFFNVANFLKDQRAPLLPIRRITVFPPDGKNISCLENDISTWLSLAKWKNSLLNLKQSGALVDTKFYKLPDRYVFEYTFRSLNDLEIFERFADINSDVDQVKKKEMGYFHKIELVSASDTTFDPSFLSDVPGLKIV